MSAPEEREQQAGNLVGITAPGATTGIVPMPAGGIGGIGNPNPPPLDLGVHSVYPVLPVNAKSITIHGSGSTNTWIITQNLGSFVTVPGQNGGLIVDRLFTVPTGSVFVVRHVRATFLSAGGAVGPRQSPGYTPLMDEYPWSLFFTVNTIPVPFNNIGGPFIDADVFFIAGPGDYIDAFYTTGGASPFVGVANLSVNIDISGDLLISHGLQKEWEIAL